MIKGETSFKETGGMYSIKDKLMMYETMVSDNNSTLANMNSNINQFIEELSDLTKKTNNTTSYICKDVSADCMEKQEYIQRHMGQQKAENIRLNNEISDLKVANNEFKNTIALCQKKLEDLRQKIGVENINIK